MNNASVLTATQLSDYRHIASQTPFYLYDKNRILENIRTLKTTFHSSIHFYYAIKANPLPQLVEFISHHVDGFDVSSQQELLTAFNTAIGAQNISIAGPAKTTAELKAAISSACLIHAESINEVKKIIGLATELNKQPNICLRINPDFCVQRAGISMTGHSSAFGIDSDQVAAVLEYMKQHHITCQGFHFYSASQILSADALIATHRAIFELVQHWADEFHFVPRYLNIGGGFGVTYFQHESALDINAVAHALEHLRPSLPASTRLVIELGRYILNNAGYYVCRIQDIKISKGKKILITDGGLHHHLANSGNLGQVIRKNYPVKHIPCHLPVQASNAKVDENKAHPEKVDVYGPLCTPLDIMAKDIQVINPQAGDFFVVEQSAAYGKTASPQEFLSRPKVAELMI